jgi:hypothetical protein
VEEFNATKVETQHDPKQPYDGRRQAFSQKLHLAGRPKNDTAPWEKPPQIRSLRRRT